MEKVDVIVKRIERVLPKELGGVLNELNNTAYQEHCCPEKFYHKVSCSKVSASGTHAGAVG